MECTHEAFTARVDVERITGEEGGEVLTYNVLLRVSCAVCSAELSFEGLPRGVNLKEPMAGVFGLEARLPAHILTDRDKIGETMRVTVHRTEDLRCA